MHSVTERPYFRVSLILAAVLLFALAVGVPFSTQALFAQNNSVDYDTDGDGLIEVSNLWQLNAIRDDLDGGGWTGGTFASYTAAFRDTVSGMGCPDTGCRGYELVADLDFDTNGNGYADEGDIFWNGGAGWDPIGDKNNGYIAEFNGNGHTISNLYINRSGGHVALFAEITGSGFIHHVGLLNVNITGGGWTAALVGHLNTSAGAVSASYATGRVAGGDETAGLVGDSNGYVVASWTDTVVTGGDDVGGVVGENSGAILSVYALGTVSGSSDTHGVVGYTENQQDLDSTGVYYNSDRYQVDHFPYSRSLSALKDPTGYSGIYAKWNVDTDRLPAGVYSLDDPWDFGTSGELPALKADRNGDGVATWQEFGRQRRGGKDYDRNDNGLIYVSNWERLNAIRYDLDGDGAPSTEIGRYLRAYPNAAYNMGCPETCKGYELTADLDHDTKGRAGVGPADPYWNDGAGWRPIGHDDDGAYTGEFDGNGRSISNLYINRGAKRVGLFGTIGGSAYIHHVGLPYVNITTDGHDVGALVGFVKGNQARVSANYATGSVVGGGQTGGLVGSNQGYVRANWAEISVHGAKHVGGLVGHNGGEVSAAYSLGTVSGDDRVHGVVGWTDGGVLNEVYFRSDINPDIDDIHAKTKAELATPTDYTGIYADWDVDLDGDGASDDPWDFWTERRYPRLKADRNADGRFTRAEFEGQNPGDIIGNLEDYDNDNDNLIEVTHLGQLNAVRYDLDGDGEYDELDARQYQQAYPNHLSGLGCPDACKGYELATDLDFDTNGNGKADARDAYWNDGAGWDPIGNAADGAYSGEFHGNGHTISNLYIDREGNQVGLFGKIGGTGFLHHVGLLNASVTTGGHDVGALVGFMKGNQTAVAASFASRGSVIGGGQTGGLVGSNQGWVVASWTDLTVQGTKHVGGLVGHNGGSVASAFAVGTVSGDSWVHGAVGATVGSAKQLIEVYYDSDNHPGNDAPYSKTTEELQAPTDYTGIYANWNVDTDRQPAGVYSLDDPWDFGTASDYPRLKADRSSEDGGL